MVASWTMSLNTPKAVNRTGQVPQLIGPGQERIDKYPDGWGGLVAERSGEPADMLYSKGSQPGIDVALRESAGWSQTYHLGDTVYITNGVVNEIGQHYASGVENGDIRLRAVNRPGDAMRRSVDQTLRWYSDMSYRSAARLAQKKL
jgi:hypothetical protein